MNFLFPENAVDTQIATLFAALREAPAFESAARILLRTMLTVVADTLGSSDYRDTATLCRGLAHLRPGGDYRALVVVEADGQEAADTGAGGLLPSASAWKLVTEHRRAVAVDVQLGVYEVPGLTTLRQSSGRLAVSTATVQRLLDRDATHVLVLPLRGPQDYLIGMVSFEIMCHRAKGRPFIWGQCVESLQLLADLAAPLLSALPPREAPVSGADELLPVVGRSMASLVKLLRVFARQEETVLITGPTGAGKSRLAHWCHAQSPRASGPFQTVDLLTVPEEMQMGELFGWRKGAFTGAISNQKGCVAQAEGGTLFIDEIDKLSLRSQAGLLQLLENRQYRVLGDPGGAQEADVRFLVGTNADLQTAVAEGRFREDLYYRINVLPVRLPPLAERRDEIGAWARYLLERRHRDEAAAVPLLFAPELGPTLEAHPWPGNLRQLDNVMRRAYAMALAEANPGAPLTVGVEQVARALTFEAGSPRHDPLTVLEQAARAWVAEAQRAQAQGAVLDLNHTGALRGLVLDAAREVCGDLRDAYRLFGLERLVASRNHHRDFQKAMERVAALQEALGRPVTPIAP